MSESFQLKFKDKIRFMDKHGLQQTLQPQNTQGMSSNAFSSFTTNSSNKAKINKANSYNHNTKYTNNNQYGTTGMSNNLTQKRRNILGYSDKMVLNNDSPRKCRTIQVPFQKNMNVHKNLGHELGSVKQLDSLDKQRILLNSKSQSQQNCYEAMMKNKLVSSNMNEEQMSSTNMSRNPEIEHLAIKLREKQKQKFKQASAPKYIDQMLGKHEQLLKMIDFKTKYKTSQSQSKQFLEKNHISKIPSQKIILSKISLDSQRSTKQENTPNASNKGQKLIKLKKIQDIIAQTKLNQQQQKQLQKFQPKQPEPQSPYVNTKYIKQRKAFYNKMNKLNTINHISDITPHTSSMPRKGLKQDTDAQYNELDNIPDSHGSKTYDASYNIGYSIKPYERPNLEKYKVSHW